MVGNNILLSDDFLPKVLYIIYRELSKKIQIEDMNENQLTGAIVPKIYEDKAIYDLFIQLRDIFEEMLQHVGFQNLHQPLNVMLGNIYDILTNPFTSGAFFSF
ncbi:hypothetical protein PVAND_002951 [Polypedilum vanderplanki]|uniref:Uncharacterized protein n=1 Tax=Polypedilum vanderplanki TaxID=319348 RepID=A0A9J6BU93_POLVA|nr:hypothetical protein PVAND_002951 [Polypedilum vanderplanki]